uniref:gamma-interferon-inducible lysosomal thiol reductase-like isoform X2 n=1 Tax=Fragaria vesca subsp. vesca TaxID=101020 RepID=UPI0005C9E8FD|nr:PREDICTED: gamma-interferon-inducible lysosomal thiol reductase-like isoform X2 [Fragaria vesca subsp. vesca]
MGSYPSSTSEWSLGATLGSILMALSPARLVPWGDVYANKSNNSTAFCQHRPDQCKLNSLQSCAIDVMHDVNKHFALIYYIEFLAIEGRQKEWETCFRSLGLPKKHILDCYNCSNATKLEQNYGNEIMHLNPPLEFVPWLVLNNQPTGNDYENFAGYVCKAYKCKIVSMT